LLEILDEPEDIQDIEHTVDIDHLNGDVEFKNVTHKYASEDEEALKNVTFKAPKGTTIGLLGATGSGKTTITQLISRFYEPKEGSILIDGRDLKEYSIQTLRKNVGVVLQETFLFSSTIRDNIAYGDADVDFERVEDAAKRAQAHDFIMEPSLVKGAWGCRVVRSRGSRSQEQSCLIQAF
jgi:ABC-type multidrug transport system fused ATPase/permease subunit